MNMEYFNKFEEAKKLGLKAEAKSNIRMFIDSFSDADERFHWVTTYLEKGGFGHKIRHELYDEIVFPVLLNGYHDNDPWSLYWLAQTIQNVYGSKKLHKQIDFKTDCELLQVRFESDQTDGRVRLALLASLISGFEYAVHEWPSGVLYAPDESPEDLLREIEYARSLDIEKKHTDFFAGIEAIVNEARRLG